MKLLIVFSTFRDRAAAMKTARRLLEAKLAACVNIVPSIESVYWWKGRVNRSREALAIIKTTTGRYREVERAILATHTYETPEILAVRASGALKAYAAWVAGACKATAAKS
jgi:uncharacterized protein involved in tolerance to divalent cations